MDKIRQLVGVLNELFPQFTPTDINKYKLRKSGKEKGTHGNKNTVLWNFLSKVFCPTCRNVHNPLLNSSLSELPGFVKPSTSQLLIN